MPIPRGDPGVLRAQNRQTTLNCIRRLGPTSRTQLTELTGLSAASVSGVTAELIAERLLVERSVGEAGASGGRRPIYLDIDYAAHYAVGLKLREDRIEAVLTDLSLKVVSHLTATLERQEPGYVVGLIRSIVRRLPRRAVLARAPVGAAIGLLGARLGLRPGALHRARRAVRKLLEPPCALKSVGRSHATIEGTERPAQALLACEDAPHSPRYRLY